MDFDGQPSHYARAQILTAFSLVVMLSGNDNHTQVENPGGLHCETGCTGISLVTVELADSLNTHLLFRLNVSLQLLIPFLSTERTFVINLLCVIFTYEYVLSDCLSAEEIVLQSASRSFAIIYKSHIRRSRCQ